MAPTLVGNTRIGSGGEGLFEQTCGCNQFPCSCYYQDASGRWNKVKKNED